MNYARVLGTVLAALFTDDITAARWTAQQPLQFRETILIAGLTLAGIAAALVAWGSYECTVVRLCD